MSERLKGWVTGVFIGDKPGIEKTPVGLIVVNRAGIVGDKHAGLTRRAGVRDKGILKGTEIPNDRQWSAVSVEELEEIAKRLGISHIDPAWLGANFAISGIPNLSKQPSGSELILPKARLVVAKENTPCINPGEVIAEHYKNTETPTQPSKFVKAAWERRGVVGLVADGGEGTITIGDPFEIVIFKP